MILTELVVPAAQFEQGTGWALKPQGACRGEVCVPLPAPPGPMVDVAAVASALGMPLVRDEAAGLWALGPASLEGHALPTAVLPEIELPDVDGNPFQLSSLVGQKVVLVAWAPY
jgi:hypothetical protein